MQSLLHPTLDGLKITLNFTEVNLAWLSMSSLVHPENELNQVLNRIYFVKHA